MADKTIGFKIEADAGIATSSVKNFKQELKLAQQEVVILSEKFGATSKEAAAAAQKAAGLKDAIGDAASLVDSFNPDTKFRAFGAAINTVVGGFSALTGVMGLVGAESKETEKLLLKVQSAMAISQGIAQLQEGIQTFKNLGAVIQSTTIFQKANAAATAIAATVMRAFGASAVASATGFQILKVAIAATGIGLLVVGLSVLIPKITEWINSTDAAALSQDALNESVERVNDSLDKNLNKIDFAIKKELLNAEIAGKSAKELQDIKEKGLRKELTQLTVAANLKAALANRAIAEGKLEVTELNKIRDDALDAEAKRQKKFEELQLAGLQFQATQAKKAREESQAAADKAAAEREKNREKPRLEKDPLSRIQGLDIEIPKTEKQIQIENEENALLKAASTNQATKDLIANTDKEFTRIHGENVDERMANERAELEAKQTIANAGISILGSLSALVGQQTKAGKILALAEIAAGTAKGFINALNIAQASAKAAGPGAAFAFPIFYATQIAAVLAAAAKAKGILASSGGGGGSASISAPSPASVAAPLSPQKPQQTTTTLDQDSLNSINNATVRAYVLESDVENNRSRIVRLNRAARLGILIYAIAMLNF